MCNVVNTCIELGCSLGNARTLKFFDTWLDADVRSKLQGMTALDIFKVDEDGRKHHFQKIVSVSSN